MDKIAYAQEVIKTAYELSKTYYDKPVVVCYSGGKDSDVLLDITRKTLKTDEFRVLNSHTTLDAPETVYYIREKFAELRDAGIDATIEYPYYKGERTSIWKLILEKQMLPTRLARYCCKILKEAATPNQIALIGVRRSESKARDGRGDIGVRGRRKEDAVYKTAQHTRAMIAFDQDPDNTSTFECEIIKNAKKQAAMVSLPVYEFSDTDVWDYIRDNHLTVNPLYSKGYRRVGCIGCPLAGKARFKEFADYPKYKDNFIKTCNRLIEQHEKHAKSNKYRTGEEMFKWWLEQDPKQITIDDFMEV